MAALTADRNVSVKGSDSIATLSYLVKASTTIYKGSHVTLDATGFAIPAADTTLCHSVGVAYEQVVQGTSATKRIRVISHGLFLLTTGTITFADAGKSVYVTDSGTVSLTNTNANYVGRLAEWVTNTSGWVWIPAGPQPVTALV